MAKLIMVAICLSLAATTASGQAGYISIFGDPNGVDCGLNDVTPGLETYYIVHSGTAGATASQFWAPAPWCMKAIYLDDQFPFPVSIGDSQTGVSIGYGMCLSGPIHVLSILVFAQGLSPQCCCYYIYPHPQAPSGEIEMVDCDRNLLFAFGGIGYINPDYVYCGCWVADSGAAPTGPNGCINDPVATEEFTWGRVKSLYSK